jgi:hypothetical protein
MLLSQMETVVWTTDGTLRVTSFLGGGMPDATRRPAELVGCHVMELFMLDDGDGIPLDAHRLALGGETVAFDMSWREQAYETYVEPLRDGAGRIVGCVGVATRNHTRGEAEGDPMDERDESPHGRRDAGGGSAPPACPDIGTLVAMVQGYAHMLLLRLGPADPLRESIQEIARAGDRAARQLGARRRDGGTMPR